MFKTEMAERPQAWRRRRTAGGGTDNEVYWPRDFLARENGCSSARILAYGYDSRVTKGFDSVNQNGLFAHARDMLYALQREKPARRPVVFVAHSLGGLVVKEVLRRSEASDEDRLMDIVRSTSGVIFLGTPHRGSPEMAGLGETVRGIASAVLRVDSNAALLRTLGASNPELELGRESFLTLWRKYNFRVKTFQEAWGVSGFNLGPLNAKVVPDTSSTLDDPREHAESISANHMNMCRFSTANDPGYRKLASEITSMAIPSISGPAVDDDARAFLRSLAFEEMGNRRLNIQSALDDTCLWLYSTPQYDDWAGRKNVSDHYGLLWIKGKPGSGKSTLMKDALRRAEALQQRHTTVVGFFFNARGTQRLEKTPAGLYRSVLHQVLEQDTLALKHLAQVYVQKTRFRPDVQWHEDDMREMLHSVFATSMSRPATLFIDAMDECSDDQVRGLVRFFKALAKKAVGAGASLKICFSSRHYPHISIRGCPEVVVEDNNRADILLYIKSEAEDDRPIADLKDEIFGRSSGVFLWVVLVIVLLRKHGRGKSIKWLRQKLQEIPPELDTLFRTLFGGRVGDEASQIACLMQLVLFAVRPLTLGQLHQAIAFGRTPYPSIGHWKESFDYLDTPEMVHEMVIDLSRGLLERTTSPSSVKVQQSTTYQFIHETVREFFLSGDGFRLLGFNFSNVPGSGHSMMAACCANFADTYEYARAGASASPPGGGSGADLALLGYASEHIFDHIEAAEAAGASQREMILRLSTNSCQTLAQLTRMRSKTRFLPGSTILMATVGFGAVRAAARILSMGVDVNEAADATPLRYALHQAAAGPYDPEDASKIGPLYLPPQPDMIRLLLRSGGDAGLRDGFGRTALHVAAARTPEAVRVVLGSAAPDVNARDADGETPLHQADLGKEAAAVVKILLEHGAVAGVGDSRG